MSALREIVYSCIQRLDLLQIFNCNSMKVDIDIVLNCVFPLSTYLPHGDERDSSTHAWFA